MASEKQFSLDISSPAEIVDVLLRSAQTYYEGAGEVESAWQDPNPGKIWIDLAMILERAADQATKALKKRGF